jgi:hypothetical protein
LREGPLDIEIGVLDLTGLAMQAVREVNVNMSLFHPINLSRTETLAGGSILEEALPACGTVLNL